MAVRQSAGDFFLLRLSGPLGSGEGSSCNTTVLRTFVECLVSYHGLSNLHGALSLASNAPSYNTVGQDRGQKYGFASNEPVDLRDGKFAAECSMLYPRPWVRIPVGRDLGFFRHTTAVFVIRSILISHSLRKSIICWISFRRSYL